MSRLFRLFHAFGWLAHYVLGPAVVWLSASLPVLWWAPIFGRGDPTRLLWPCVLILLTTAAVGYEVGYKQMYRSGSKKYFYFVHALPLLIGFLGFVYGLFRVYQ